MGLSDEERLSGMYFAIKHMNEEARYLEKYRGYSIENAQRERLVGHVDGLWHGLLAGSRNSLHWILGSSASNKVTWETSGPWAEAVRYHHEEATKSDGERKFDEMARAHFDPFDTFLSISGLLQHNDKVRTAVYSIFAWSEQLIYYLRRYDDEFLKGYGDLSRMVSDIQGVCFEIFTEHDEYAKAYFLHRTLTHVYGQMWPEEKRDVVTRWLFSDNIHHDLSRPMSVNGEPLAWVVTLHRDIAKVADEGTLTKQQRLLAALKISGRRFHYVHNHEALLKMLEGDPDFNLDEVRAELARCIEADEGRKREESEEHKRRPKEVGVSR